MLKITLLIYLLFTQLALSQVDDIELEALDDFSILDEFEKEDGKIEVPQRSKSPRKAKKTRTKKDQQNDELDKLDEALGSDNDLDQIDNEITESLQNPMSEEEILTEQLLNDLDQEEGTLQAIQEDLDPPDSDSIEGSIEDDIDLSKNNLENIQDVNEQIDLDYIRNFKISRQENVDSVLKQTVANSQGRFKLSEIEALKIQFTDIAQSKIRIHHIPKGKVLTRLSDSRLFKLQQSLTVRAHVQLDYNRDKYILNKSGEMVYKIPYKHATYIDKVTNLFHTPHLFTRLPKKISRKDLQDPHFDYSLITNLHTGLNSPNYTRQLLKQPSAFAPLLRVEATVLSNTNFIFNSGLTIMFESVSGNILTGGNYSISSFSIGPSFKYDQFVGDYSLILQPRLAAFSTLRYSTDFISESTSFSETALLVGLEKQSRNPGIGSFTYGFNFQRKWLKSNILSLLDVSNQVNSDDSFAVYLGHRSDWIW